MRRIAIVLALTLIGLIFSAAAQAETVVVDFDDLPGGYPPIPAGYGGIADWTDWASFVGADDYPSHSGEIAAYCFGNGVPIIFGQEYVFDGTWVAGPVGPPDWIVWYELYLQGILVHTSDGLAPTPTPAWNPSGYSFPVDEVRIIHTFTNFFCMDDFTYTTTEIATEETAWGNVKSLFR